MSKLNPIDNPIKIQCKGAETLPLDLILDFQGKLKKLSETNRSKLMQSICDKGFIAPLFLWDDSGDYRLLDGHGRLKTLLYMREQGWDIPMLPVVHVEADNEKDARSKLLSITSQYGEFDLNELNNWIADLDDDIAESLRLVDEEIDFNIDDLGEETNGDDDAPEVPDDPETVLGDLWELGDHRLLCGDSTSITDVDKLINGVKIDLVHTDPPYGIEEKGDRSGRGGACEGSKLPDFKDDTIQYAIDAFNICDAMDIKRQVWWGANYYSHHIPQTANWFVWDKRVEENMKDTQSDCELAYVKSKWASVRIFRHVWKGMIKDSEHGSKRVHPTQKPVALVEWVIDYYRDVETILDLFGGSGSTLIGAEKKGCKSNVMELEPYYCDVIAKRYIEFCRKNKKEITVKLNGEEYTGALLDE